VGRLSNSIAAWRNATGEPSPVMEDANQVVKWSNCDYHKRFLLWLREQADQPINPRSQHADLIVANVRANTMKEIRKHLLDLSDRAHSALEIENE
jgi:hypothetical protein